MKGLFRIIVFALFMVGCTSGGDQGGQSEFKSTLKLRNEVCNFMPDNNIQVPIGAKNVSKVSESEFNEVLNEISSVYSSIVASQGANLVIRRLWSSNEFNAIAYRQGSSFVIEMYGGLARHPDVTRDAFTMVACHEIGHHLGGAPKRNNGTDWASNEGQADYFATMKCARKIFRRYPRDISNVDIEAENECKKYHSADEKNICLRSAMGGLSLAKAMSRQSGGRTPSLSLKDNQVVPVTQDKHPAAQCRLDTYFQGGLCQVSDGVDFNDRNANVGACTYAQSESYGARPMCWFKPAVSTGPGPNPTPTPNPNPNPEPPPADGVAGTPLLNGQTELQSSQPGQAIRIQWDVSSFQQARGVYVEISRPNQPFSNPNDVNVDPSSLGGTSVAQTQGTVSLVPQRDLPGWGVYQIRVIPLDASGRVAVGQFSNPSTLRLQQR